VAKVYIVSFRTHNDRRPSKFIVLANDTGHQRGLGTWRADFQARFDKATGQAQEMKAGVLRIL